MDTDINSDIKPKGKKRGEEPRESSGSQLSVQENNDQALISAEEAAFIHKTISLSGVGGSDRTNEDPMTSRDLDALVIGQMLLQTNRYSLETKRGNFTYRFRPRFDRCATTNRFYIDLGYPSIIDQNGVERELRVSPTPGEIRLTDQNQQLICSQILDISATGVRLRGSHRANLKGMRLNSLLLDLGDAGSFSLFGRVTRVITKPEGIENEYCIKFERPSLRLAETLWEYVFRRFHTWSGDVIGP